MFRFATTQWAGFGGRCLSMTGSLLCPSGHISHMWSCSLYISCICHSSSLLQDKWFWLCLRPKDQGEEHVPKITIYGRSGDWRSHSISSRRGWLGCTLQVRCLLTTYNLSQWKILLRKVKCQAWQNSLRGSNRAAPQLMARGEKFLLFKVKLSKVEWRGFAGSRGFAHNHICRAPELPEILRFINSTMKMAFFTFQT